MHGIDMTSPLRRSIRAALRKLLAWAAVPLDEQLAASVAPRGRNGFRWFTPEEVSIAQALGCTIIPSDDATPGFDDIEVLGPAGVNLLDAIVAADGARQAVYGRGLLSFDLWARHEYGCGFAAMTKTDQIALFSAAQVLYESWSSGSRAKRAMRRVGSILHTRSGHYFAATLFPIIISDCFQVFYTSRVSWVWLEYDGPPMDEGYPMLAPKREFQNVSAV
jgi:hypothetical protein